MTIISVPTMIFSFKSGWSRIEQSPPSAGPFGATVLALALLPPLMLYHAGTAYGDAFVAGYGAKPWEAIAVAFFATEIATLFGMGWFIRQVAAGHGVDIGRRNALTLAAIAPMPLWLSSLGLLVPSLAFNVVLSLAALAAACSLIYHGVYALCHMHEEVTAASVTQTVMGAGLVAWAMLLLLVMTMS